MRVFQKNVFIYGNMFKNVFWGSNLNYYPETVEKQVDFFRINLVSETVVQSFNGDAEKTI
jgi:hypothetical protein